MKRTGTPWRVPSIIDERESTHGDFRKQGAFAQQLKCLFVQQPNAAKLSPHQSEALEMIATKISRILHGDAQHRDSWIDIAGYAQLGAPDEH